ncbi:MAG TPA: MaoC/PaaZ C-terminal domain-containing protein [Acidimicrobiia bacterium]|nr:MaoC/PaaZ C-terminal domain-containing protein [Acidimicrobiia bacterium]
MQEQSPPSFPAAGTDLGRYQVTVTEAAAERYWRGAGIEAPGRLAYPPMAVNLTILLVQQTVPISFLHTRERLASIGAVEAPCDLVVTGRCVDRFDKRGRPYFVVDSTVATADGRAVWRSLAELCSSRPGGGGEPGVPEVSSTDWGDDLVPPDGGETRRLDLTYDLLRTYSRAGNFHSDDEAARQMGLPGMVAMGMQTLGPAYGAALERWGEAFVEGGGVEARFFGMVSEAETVETRTEFGDGVAWVEISNVERDARTGLARFAQVAQRP